jgi:uncharacterized protein (TIGR02147 family)
MANHHPIEVFDYFDYRAFLRDYYAYMKKTRRGFSFRAFSLRAKLGSPNYLKRVMEGDRNLTLEMAERFAQACGLQGEGAEYFVQLVAFNQASSSSERSRAYAKLTGFKTYRRTRKLDIAQAAYHSNWYIPAVRELAGRRDFEPDPVWIATRLLPPIKPSEARDALAILIDLGLLKSAENGRVMQSEPLISTGPEAHEVHIAQYHRTMMRRAADAIDFVPSAERDISSVTMLVSKGGLGRMKKRIQRFRRELMEMALSEDEGKQVVQLNLQLFPLSLDPDREPDR